MSGVQSIEVEPSEDGMRLDRWFKVRFPGLGHGALQKLLRTGQVRLDGGRAKANARVEAGQTVRVPPLDDQKVHRKPKRETPLSAKDLSLIRSLVIHRDNHVIALNKPAGLATQGGSKTERHIDGMLDGLIFDGDERPRLVHRLDRDTSGVLLLARSRKAAAVLAKSFQSRETEKTYWALVTGVPRPEQGRIDLPIVKVGKEGDQRMAPATKRDDGAQRAVTVFTTVERAGRRFSWLALSPLTGRTHQLRVHMEAIGHPVVGDGKYRGEGGGEEVEDWEGIDDMLHLHARSLRIPHPAGAGMIDVSAPLPEHMQRTWQLLGFDPKEGDELQLFGEEDGSW